MRSRERPRLSLSSNESLVRMGHRERLLRYLLCLWPGPMRETLLALLEWAVLNWSARLSDTVNCFSPRALTNMLRVSLNQEGPLLNSARESSALKPAPAIFSSR